MRDLTERGGKEEAETLRDRGEPEAELAICEKKRRGRQSEKKNNGLGKTNNRRTFRIFTRFSGLKKMKIKNEIYIPKSVFLEIY